MNDKERLPKSVTPADCGARYNHKMHIFETERGKIKACDGTINKDRK